MIIFQNGEFKDVADGVVHINDSSFLMGFGAYETMRTLNGKIVLLDEHLERFYNFFNKLNLECPYSKADLISILEELLERNIAAGFDMDFRIRITASFGGFNPFEYTYESSNILIQCAPLNKAQVEPVKVVTFNVTRSVPRIKSTSTIASVLAKKHALENNAYESILINDDTVFEASYANVFIVKNDALITPKNGILGGVTRDAIIKLSATEIEVKEREVFLEELYDADEIFLTNSTNGVIPVSHIDNKVIGSKANSGYTDFIRQRYNHYIST